MDSDWNNHHEVTIDEIIYVIYNISPEEYNNIKDMVHKLSDARQNLISKHIKKSKEERLEREQQSQEDEIIGLNTILIRDVLDEIEVKIPPSTSFMLGAIYYSNSCDVALRILQNSEFKDKHHHKDTKYDLLHSFKEYMNVVRDSFMKALTDDGIGENNATRISTKLTGKLRNELKSKLNL